MSLTVEELYDQLLTLPDESQEALAERLMANLAAKIDPAVERAHLATAKERRDQIRSGKVEALEGPDVLNKARQIVNCGMYRV